MKDYIGDSICVDSMGVQYSITKISNGIIGTQIIVVTDNCVSAI